MGTRFLRTWMLSSCLACLVAACETDYDTCSDPGASETCDCNASARGERVCLPERVWGKCDCSAGSAGDAGDGMDSGMPMSGSGGMAGMMSGAGGSGAGGMAGMMSGAGGSGTGGMAGTMSGTGGGGMDATDGSMPDPDGGDDAAAGSAGAEPEGPAYAGCTTATVNEDCRAGSSCESSDVSLVQLTALQVCAPACTTPTDCPAPEGTGFTAMLACEEERCRLDCAGFPQLTCPTGMTCATVGFASYCFDDGM